MVDERVVSKGGLTPNSLSQLNLGSVHLVKIQASSKCIRTA